MKYFTGKSCQRGHRSQRQTSNRTCLKCQLMASRKFEARHRVRRREKDRKWRMKNAKYNLERMRRWRKQNADKQREAERNWRRNNPEKVRAKNRRARLRRHQRLLEARR